MLDLSIINQKIQKIKRQNGKGDLKEQTTHSDPFEQFLIWFNEAIDSDIYDPSAMVLATVDQKGLPDTRVVLLKELEYNRFIFFTNYQSKKAQDLSANSIAAINFYWPSLVRQVRIRGEVTKAPRSKSQNYFKTRPKEAQIGVYASLQSSIIPNREALDKEYERFTKQFDDTEVPCPEYWGGYILTPFEYEFFQGRKWRTHDRIFYFLQNNQWLKQRLAP